MNDLNVSIQQGWINKYDTENYPIFNAAAGKQYKYSMSRGWINIDLSLKDFISAVCVDGYAFCPQMTDAKHNVIMFDEITDFDKHYWNGTYKRDEYFHKTNLLTIDIDEGYDLIEEILDIDYFKEYGMLLYTSPSYDKNNNKIKVRLVFKLEYAIEKIDDYKNLITGAMSLMTKADKACKDACRMFYGSKDSEYFVFEENYIHSAEIKRLIKLGKNFAKKTVGYNKKKTKGDIDAKSFIQYDHNYLPDDTTITLADNSIYSLKELPSVFKSFSQDLNNAGSVVCYCPFPDHNDSSPSAFCSVSKGLHIPYVFCSKCSPEKNNGRAWFMDTSEKNDLGEKDEFNVKFVNERYLSTIPQRDGITFVKSAKGTGKTERLVEMVKNFKKEGKSILLLGHRVSLLQSMAKRLGLDFYKDKKYTKGANTVFTTKTFCICIDSLWRIKDFSKTIYDVVIIDESEQVINHFTGKTIQKRMRKNVTKKFFDFIYKAKQVYALDADISDFTINTLTDIIFKPKNDEVFGIINEWKPENKKIEMYENKMHFIDDMIETIENNPRGRFAIFANSKKFILDFEQQIKEWKDFSYVCITSDNSKNDEIQKFIENINECCKKLNLLLTSPSIGTGVDITVEYDHVFGVFEHATGNSHYDIDQHLYRIRNTKNTSVWISSAFGCKETNPEKLYKRMIIVNETNNNLIEYDTDDIDKLSQDFLRIYSMAVAKNNKSVNQLRTNWLGLQHNNNIVVEIIEKPEKLDMPKSDDFKLTREKFKEEQFMKLLEIVNSEVDYEEVIELKKMNYLTNDEKITLEAHQIQEFFQVETTKIKIDEKLLEEIQAGLMIDISNFCRLTQPLDMCRTFDLNDRYNNFEINDRHQTVNKVLTQQLILEWAGFNDYKDFNHTVNNDVLNNNGFVSNMINAQQEIQETLNITLRSNFITKPYQTLAAIISGMGIKLDGVSKRVEGKIQRFYTIDPNHIEIMETYAKHRLNIVSEWEKSVKLKLAEDILPTPSLNTKLLKLVK